MGVVLAAGAGRRFGGPKQLAMIAGRPLVAHVVATMLDTGLDVVVAVAAGADAVAAAARAAAGPDRVARVRIVEVGAQGGEGIGTSLAVAAAAAGARPLVVALADQPGLVHDDVGAVTAALVRGAGAVRIQHPDGPGHPVGFGPGAHASLVALAGTAATGRDVLDDLDVEEIEVLHARPPDVDTPQDLEEVIASWPDREGISPASPVTGPESSPDGPAPVAHLRSDS